jgi:UDP-GlcNAc:undecaprenyl-phosphate GlcNAc-1-phosphate transferase
MNLSFLSTNYQFIIAGLLALALTVVGTWLVKKIAWRYQIIDNPDARRKLHHRPTPLLGGLAIFLGFFVVLFLFSKNILSGDLIISNWLGVLVGGLFLMLGGLLDDKYNLRPSQQIVFPLLAILAVIIGGVSIEKITNPLGGYLYLSLTVSSLIIGLWLLGMMYTTKLLDGVDGLVTGTTAVGAFIIFLFTLTTKYFQPDIAMAAIILGGSCLGFLIFNFNPAKIFLGEGGSLLLGYLLGVLAIISGGKLAIALLVMGIPILDVMWTIARRLLQGQNPFRFADRKHLHHRLLDLGLSPKQTVLVFYSLALIFGLSGLFLQSQGKLLALAILVFLMLVVVVGFSFWEGKKPTLLLHICCAPCGGYAVYEVLRKKYDLTLYFCNPNLDTAEEFHKRLQGVITVSQKAGVPLIIEGYDHEIWQKSIKGHEQDLERGARCLICYRGRLEKTAALAREKKIKYFCTTLTASPYKDSATIMSLGRELAKEQGVEFLEYDLKANGGFQKAQEFAKQLGIYRQKYCGCELAKNE